MTTLSSKAQQFAAAAAPPLRETAESMLHRLQPALALAMPLVRRLNWRMVAFGVVAAASGYLVRSMMEGKPATGGRSTKHKPHELNRWENEGGMIATTAPSATRRVDHHGDVGTGAGDPPLNS